MPMRAGARNVTVRGPMEGAGTRAELDRFIAGDGAAGMMQVKLDRLAQLAKAAHARHHLGLLRAPARASRPPCGTARDRRSRADRSDLQPGQPPGRLHRHAACRLRRPRPRDRRRARLPRRAARPRRRPPRPEPVARSARRSGDGQGRGDGRGLRRCRLPQDPSRLLDGLRRRARRRSDATTAGRAVRLAAVAEAAAAAGGEMPVYVIGTEVPLPGGADHALDRSRRDHARGRARHTLAVHRAGLRGARARRRLRRASSASSSSPASSSATRNVVDYDRSKARGLAASSTSTGLVFEAHSTDYQGAGPLRELVEDGFAILKVGPELTFVLREALYALDLIASDLLPDYGDRPLMQAMEALMLRAAGQLEPPLPRPTQRTRACSATTRSPTASATIGPRPRRRRPARLFAVLRGRSVPSRSSGSICRARVASPTRRSTPRRSSSGASGRASPPIRRLAPPEAAPTVAGLRACQNFPNRR